MSGSSVVLEPHTALDPHTADVPLSAVLPQTAEVPSVVLDPFAGTGTTLQVARWLGRDYVGIEANERYLELIEQRLRVADERITELDAFRRLAASRP